MVKKKAEAQRGRKHPKITLYMKTPKLSKRPPKTNKTNTGTNKSLWLDNHRKQTWCKTGDVGKSKETSIRDKNEKEKSSSNHWMEKTRWLKGTWAWQRKRTR